MNEEKRKYFTLVPEFCTLEISPLFHLVFHTSPSSVIYSLVLIIFNLFFFLTLKIRACLGSELSLVHDSISFFHQVLLIPPQEGWA